MRTITIGRASDNDIVINDPLVGRKQCQITLDNDGNICLIDLGSINGVYVNGNRISGEVTISCNDIIKIGNTTLPLKGQILDLLLQGLGENSPFPNYPPRESAMCYCPAPDYGWVGKKKKKPWGCILGIVAGILLGLIIFLLK